MRLNLGCGHNRIEGAVNVDKFGAPDVLHDLETFPWPWPDNSVEHIELRHVLEHLGSTPAIYLKIFQEMYRICQPGANILIQVPHPRHDLFLDDPTHVRVVTLGSLYLFNQRLNDEWRRLHYPNSPLGQYLGIDFETVGYSERKAQGWQAHVPKEAERYHINTIEECLFRLQAIKPQRFPLNSAAPATGEQLSRATNRA